MTAADVLAALEATNARTHPSEDCYILPFADDLTDVCVDGHVDFVVFAEELTKRIGGSS